MLMTKAKLLITDDDPAIREILSELLAEIGYQVRIAEDGFTALAEIRKDAPDILLSDLNMPGMSGFELLCLVRNRFPGIQTIAMSGMFSGSEVPLGVAADAFFQKGTAVESLFGIVQSLAENGQVSAERATTLIPESIEFQDDADRMETEEGNNQWMISLVRDETISQMKDIVCEDCRRLIQAAFARPDDQESLFQSHGGREANSPALNKHNNSMTKARRTMGRA
jgi:CheY-like chemotaxis protein